MAPSPVVRLVLCCCAVALAGCATSQPQAGIATAPAVTPIAMVHAIRAAAGSDDSELAVQPLREPMVEDLRAQAQGLEAAGRFADAAAALDHALQLVPDDPALLQERAEAAVLTGHPEAAAVLAEHAWELGGKVGPLCRRHAETLRQVRLAAGDAAGAAAEARRRDACTVTGPVRY